MDFFLLTNLLFNGEHAFPMFGRFLKCFPFVDRFKHVINPLRKTVNVVIDKNKNYILLYK